MYFGNPNIFLFCKIKSALIKISIDIKANEPKPIACSIKSDITAPEVPKKF